MGNPDVAVVICSLNRPQELQACVRSLDDPTLRIQWCLLTERGSLPTLRNHGLAAVRAPVTVFTDDDIVASSGYLRRVLRTLDIVGRVGCTGPAVIPLDSYRNRDLFRYPVLWRFYQRVFLHGEFKPCHLLPWGTPTIIPDATGYTGPCHYLEACHAAYQTEALRSIGAFDEAYGGVGDWSEPDVGCRLRQRFGELALWYSDGLRVEHRVSTTGAYALRLADRRQRLANATLFLQRWATPSWRRTCYWGWLWGYYEGWQRLKALTSSRPMTSC